MYTGIHPVGISSFQSIVGQYTEDEARKLGVVGWVKNTRQGTVTGQVQGPEDKVNAIACLSPVYYPKTSLTASLLPASFFRPPLDTLNFVPRFLFTATLNTEGLVE
ncbi:acylphosphatase-2 isoform X2 [Alligator sinensis]|uniref:Acylphosphatase-2 n=1 Tax=Alligator sinensis TaxID=38654 RepID=A0A3Q0GD43_ALLSI|nr:acylphosphatase-2 isoform X2 [Alligator sinensis]